MAKLHDLTGMTFGDWKVMYRNGSTKNKASVWHCKCLLCNSEHDVVGASLYNGLSTKCRSCVPRKTLSKGYTSDPLYTVYQGIKARCYNKNNSHYHNYGARGITMCKEWLVDINAFIDWCNNNGWSHDLTIDRINANGNYEPSNIRFVTRAEQQRNKRSTIIIKYNGEVGCLTEMCRKYNISYNSVRSAHYRGDTHQSAFVRLANLKCVST